MSTGALHLTTTELLTRCEEATGVRFTVHQLGDWAKRGLLPSSKPGKGRGRRVGGSEPRQWDAECLPRLCVIARAQTGKYVSISRAAYALAAEGYAIDTTLLRGALSDCLYMLHAGMAEALTWKRPFLNNRSLSAEEKRQRLHRSELHKYRHIAPPMREVVERAKVVMLGLATASHDDALEQLLSTFSYEQVKTSLEQSSDEEIVQMYRVICEGLPLVMPRLLPMLSMFLAAGMALPLAADPPEWARLQTALGELAQLFPADDAVAVASKFRLPMMLVLLHIRGQGIAHVDELALAAVQHLTTTFVSQMGEAGVALQVALERGLNDVTDATEANGTAKDSDGEAS